MLVAPCVQQEKRRTGGSPSRCRRVRRSSANCPSRHVITARRRRAEAAAGLRRSAPVGLQPGGSFSRRHSSAAARPHRSPERPWRSRENSAGFTEVDGLKYCRPDLGHRHARAILCARRSWCQVEPGTPHGARAAGCKPRSLTPASTSTSGRRATSHADGPGRLLAVRLIPRGRSTSWRRVERRSDRVMACRRARRARPGCRDAVHLSDDPPSATRSITMPSGSGREHSSVSRLRAGPRHPRSTNRWCHQPRTGRHAERRRRRHSRTCRPEDRARRNVSNWTVGLLSP